MNYSPSSALRRSTQRAMGLSHPGIEGEESATRRHLTDRVLEITRRLMLAHPEGPMFRNSDGNPWCVSSVKCRFQRLPR